MRNLFTQLWRWRTPGRSAPDAATPYEVFCSCGQDLQGLRQARRQIVPCPACGRKLFVLARSPLPPPEGDLAPKPAPASGLLGRFGAWRLPFLAAGATLAVLIALFFVLLPFLGRSSPTATDYNRPTDVEARAAAGRRALSDGDFYLASKELQAALEADRRHPEALSSAERRELIQLQRQSELLSRLSNRSLQEIVQEAELVRHDEEWKARFETDYKGKSVVFDDLVRLDDAALPDGRRRPVLGSYRVTVGGKQVRLALEEVHVLEGLPLERPRRLLFGVCLAGVERGAGGQWVVHFDPDDGALLTDRGAAEAVCPTPLDRELLDVLNWQGEWLQRN